MRRSVRERGLGLRCARAGTSQPPSTPPRSRTAAAAATASAVDSRPTKRARSQVRGVTDDRLCELLLLTGAQAFSSLPSDALPRLPFTCEGHTTTYEGETVMWRRNSKARLLGILLCLTTVSGGLVTAAGGAALAASSNCAARRHCASGESRYHHTLRTPDARILNPLPPAPT